MSSGGPSISEYGRPVPTLADPGAQRGRPTYSPTSSSSSSLSEGEGTLAPSAGRSRPRIGARKKSGTIVVSKDTPAEHLEADDFDEDDARAMSPRRNSEDVERMSQDARKALEEQAQALQASLLALIDKVETVKSDHDRLEGENRFLQSYIGELMSTSKITSTGAGKGRSNRSK